MLDSTTAISFATRIMKRSGEDSIVVIKEGKPVGIVTDQDILDNIAEKGLNPFGSSLEVIMSSPLITIEPDASVRDAIRKMKESNVRKLIVMENSIAMGIITQPMIARAIRNTVMAGREKTPLRIKPVLGNLGFVLQFAGALIIVPALVSTLMNEPATATGIYLMGISMLVTGFFLNAYGEKAPLNLWQASVLVLSSFLLLSLFGMIPYTYLDPYNSSDTASLLVDSFFESVSGFTTTGLSLISAPEDLPHSFVFYRSYTQWVGGLSFIYLVMTAFYPENKLAGMRSLITGKTLHLKELFVTITVVFTIYTIVITAILYGLGQEDLINDISIVLSGLSTGGFVPDSTFLPRSDWYELLIITAAMILGALPFTYHYAVIKRRFLTPRITKEIAIFLLVIVASAAIAPAIANIDAFTTSFHVVAASTTSGYQFIKVDSVNEGTKVLLIILMLVGGCAFSTAGGVKILRFITLVETSKKIRYAETRAKLTTIDYKEFASAIIIIILFPLMAYLTSLQLMGEGYSFIDSFFEATATISNGGLSVGVTNLELSATSKILMPIVMILGRFEIIAIIYIFVPRLMY